MAEREADPAVTGAHTLASLASAIGCTLRGRGDVNVSGCASLMEATPAQVSFLANPKYETRVRSSQAAAVILSPAHVSLADPEQNLLIAADPYFVFRQAMVLLHGFPPRPAAGVSEQAVVHPSATLGPGVSVGPFASVGPGACLGANTQVGPGCHIGAEAVLGADCVLHPNVVVYPGCRIGDRCVFHSGCVVGQDGFGFASHGGVHHKIPSAGGLVIEDDVELGAGCTIERATVGQTVIGAGSKFADLVAVGHGAKIGRHNLVVAQVGIAGTAVTGDHVTIGGQAGVAGHLRVGDGVRVAAKAGVIGDVPDATAVGGMPAGPFGAAKRSMVLTRKLPAMQRRVRTLEARLAALEAKLAQLTPQAEPDSVASSDGMATHSSATFPERSPS